MAKIPRQTYFPFGASGPTDDFEAFGSTALGSTVYTKDIPTIQNTVPWGTGWRAALLSGLAPTLQDQNSVEYVHGNMIAYQLQQGIAEWDTGTTYYVGSVVMRPSSFEMYVSQVDVNVGNALPSQVDDGNWLYVGLLMHGSLVPAGTMLDFAGPSAPAGYLGCDGSAVSRSTYSILFGVIGTTWGVGNGTTTFNLPNFQRRVAVGSGGSGTGVLGNALGNTGGAETHVLSTAEMPSHTHPETGNNGVGGSNLVSATTTATGANTLFNTTGATGGGGAHTIVQPSAVVFKIIKY